MTSPAAKKRLPTASQAERDWYIAATANEAAERAKFLVETSVLEEDLLERRRGRKWEEAYARERRVFDFAGDLAEYTVKDAVDTLHDWATVSLDPITIRLCSPGGSVFDGLALFDVIRDIRKIGVYITTYAVGYAASMASILLQAGDHRRISRNTWFMVHEPSSIALGKASALHDEAALLQKLHRQLIGIAAERSTLTEKQVLARCNRKDWWMPASDAVKFGFADELV